MSVSALSAGAYITTLLDGPGWADFTIMMECRQDSDHCHSVYSVAGSVAIIICEYCTVLHESLHLPLPLPHLIASASTKPNRERAGS
jgi:hypothetical protein